MIGVAGTGNVDVGQEAEVLFNAAVGEEVEASELLELGCCAGGGDFSAELGILPHSDGDVGRRVVSVGGSGVVFNEEIKLGTSLCDSGGLSDGVGIESGALSSVARVDGGQSLSGGHGSSGEAELGSLRVKDSSACRCLPTETDNHLGGFLIEVSHLAGPVFTVVGLEFSVGGRDVGKGASDAGENAGARLDCNIRNLAAVALTCSYFSHIRRSTIPFSRRSTSIFSVNSDRCVVGGCVIYTLLLEHLIPVSCSELSCK